MAKDHGQTFLRRFAADRSSWPIADDTRTSSRPARRAAGLVVDDGRTGRWLTELGFVGQAAAFPCDL
jgi:hypothetical protein